MIAPLDTSTTSDLLEQPETPSTTVSFDDTLDGATAHQGTVEENNITEGPSSVVHAITVEDVDGSAQAGGEGDLSTLVQVTDDNLNVSN